MQLHLKQIVFLVTLFFASILLAEEKVFTQEYTYLQNSEDSKIVARAIAMQEAQNALIAQASDYIATHLTANKLKKTFKKNAQNITIGIAKIKIIDEQYDSKSFYVKISTSVNADTVVGDIEELLVDKQRLTDIATGNEQARNALKQIRKLHKKASKQPKKYKKQTDILVAEESSRQGSRALKEQNFSLALKHYTNAVKHNPSNARAHYDRGLANKHLRNYSQAEKDYTQALGLNPKSVNAYNSRGNAYASLEKYDLAIKDYTQAIALNPKSAKAYYNRANAHGYNRKYDLAVSDYTKALALRPNLTQAYNNRGSAYDDLKKYDLAIKDYTKAITLSPNNAQAHYNRGLIYARHLQKYDLAVKDYSKALSLDPSDKLSYEQRGKAYVFLNKNKEACKDANTVKKMGDASLFNNLVHKEICEQE